MPDADALKNASELVAAMLSLPILGMAGVTLAFLVGRMGK